MPLWDDPEGLRQRAAEMRAIAAGMTDAQARDAVLRVAVAYEDLARKSEARRRKRDDDL